eukprot:TRINITY_DN1702_c1_g1_i1.p1 TRINITY_DN1702_c1_g1~~TRINITY_DN1702_c1_g1_i1.p1  ORF type:complete len:366 (-),score=120.53 TRINITY_DN1702_c1_g1_i1:116-1213(-)
MASIFGTTLKSGATDSMMMQGHLHVLDQDGKWSKGAMYFTVKGKSYAYAAKQGGPPKVRAWVDEKSSLVLDIPVGTSEDAMPAGALKKKKKMKEGVKPNSFAINVNFRNERRVFVMAADDVNAKRAWLGHFQQLIDGCCVDAGKRVDKAAANRADFGAGELGKHCNNTANGINAGANASGAQQRGAPPQQGGRGGGPPPQAQYQQQQQQQQPPPQAQYHQPPQQQPQQGYPPQQQQRSPRQQAPPQQQHQQQQRGPPPQNDTQLNKAGAGIGRFIGGFGKGTDRGVKQGQSGQNTGPDQQSNSGMQNAGQGLGRAFGNVCGGVDRGIKQNQQQQPHQQQQQQQRPPQQQQQHPPQQQAPYIPLDE